MYKNKSGEFTSVSFKIHGENSVVRNILVKQHVEKDITKPSKRTLYLLNLPQYVSVNCLKFMYKECGEIENIYFHSKPKGSEHNVGDSTYNYYVSEPNIGLKVAYIVFKDEAALKLALKLKELKPVPKKLLSLNIGMNKWAREYNSSFIHAYNVQKDIESYISNYDRKVQSEKEKVKELEVEDDEGWTMIKSTKKIKVSSDKVNKKLKDKEAKKTLLTFYRCQLRDSKMEHIRLLREKFEKDKKRILQLKANRKFKPL